MTSIKPAWATASASATTSFQDQITHAGGALQLAIDDRLDTMSPQKGLVLLDGLTELVSDDAQLQQFEQFRSGQQSAPQPIAAVGTGTPATPATPSAPQQGDPRDLRISELENALTAIANAAGATLVQPANITAGRVDAHQAENAIVAKITTLQQAAPATNTDVADFKTNTVTPAVDALEAALANGADTVMGGGKKFNGTTWTAVETAVAAVIALKA